MRMYDIIKKKRDGGALSREEIAYFVDGYVRGEVPDYQAAALLMAIYFRGMNNDETLDLTFAVRDSGGKPNFASIKGVRADKHSTGGVGDKTSLVVAPIVAACGVNVAKMSGRGLGHTGGTLDKLEAIPGFRTDLDENEFLEVVRATGVAIIGQSERLAPADKLLYALRDVTATVDSLPLVASSVMGKKLAADDDCIVLDVKTGSGAIAKTIEESRQLAQIMVDIGKRSGKKIVALITDMDAPLGRAIGNALEVEEAVYTLMGKGPDDLHDVCVELAAEMLALAEKGSLDSCRKLAEDAIYSGTALAKLKQMVKMQHGDVRYIDDPSMFGRAKFTREVKAAKDGYIVKTDAEGYGTASLILGAGRNRKEDKIDPLAGILLLKKTGCRVQKGDVIAVLYSNDQSAVEQAEQRILDSTFIGDVAPIKRNLILERII